jgi:hypothetical protein
MPAARASSGGGHLAKGVAEKATRGLATKADLDAPESRLELAMSRLQPRIGVRLGVAVTILLAGIAMMPPVVQWVVRARGGVTSASGTLFVALRLPRCRPPACSSSPPAPFFVILRLDRRTRCRWQAVCRRAPDAALAGAEMRIVSP